MSDPGPALRILLDALRDGLAKPEVRTALGELGRWLVALSEHGAPTAPPAPVEQTEQTPHAPVASQIEGRPIDRPASIVGPTVASALRIGDSNRLEVVTRGAEIVSTRELSSDPAAAAPTLQTSRRKDEPELPDLRRVAQSARLKAEACARASRGEPTDDPRDAALALRRAEDAFDGGLWMCSRLETDGRAAAARAEPCYRALAAGAEFGAFLRDRDQLHPGLGLEEPFQLMAKAQSMVRNFVDDSRGDDLDQLDMFQWLRTLTSEHRCRVHVGRFMRRTDKASPEDAPAVLAEIAATHEAWRARLDGAKERRRLIGKVRHKAGLLAAATDADAGTLWGDLERVFGDLAQLGVRTADPELAGALSGAPEPKGAIPLSEGLGEALRQARGLVQRQEPRADDEESDAGPTSPEVAEAARLLNGRVVLLIGGEVKPQRREAIERALGLRELRWIPANTSDSSTGSFEPQVRRPETALVIRMVRFTRTNHGELLDLCKRYHRPFVNLPAGYGVNQLAAEIVTQAGDQLRTMPPADALTTAG